MSYLDDVKHLIEMPEGFKPSYEDLLEAVEASCIWAILEHDNLGTFYDRMDLCSYAEWCVDKALGLPHDDEWAGVPRLVLARKDAS
jgi:hypothetical protein